MKHIMIEYLAMEVRVALGSALNQDVRWPQRFRNLYGGHAPRTEDHGPWPAIDEDALRCIKQHVPADFEARIIASFFFPNKSELDVAMKWAVSSSREPGIEQVGMDGRTNRQRQGEDQVGYLAIVSNKAGSQAWVGSKGGKQGWYSGISFMKLSKLKDSDCKASSSGWEGSGQTANEALSGRGVCMQTRV
jgi:hypothetical protein